MEADGEASQARRFTQALKDSGTPPGYRIVFCRFPGVSMLDLRLICGNPQGWQTPARRVRGKCHGQVSVLTFYTRSEPA